MSINYNNVLEIRNIKKEEIEKVSEFITNMNSKESNHIGYCGDSKKEILNCLKEDFLDETLEKCFIGAYNERDIVGILGVDADVDNGCGELWGPFVNEKFNKDEISAQLWETLKKSIKGTCSSFGLFCNNKNIACIKFGENNGFKIEAEHFIMSLNREKVGKTSDVKSFELTQEHYSEFEELHDKVFGKSYYKGSTIINNINEYKKVFIIKDNNEVVAYIYVEVEPEFGESSIDFFAVKEDKRGIGLGGKLIKIAIDWIFSFKEINDITLCVKVENQSALGLYKKCGFNEKNHMIFLKK